jgi:hypothetical protein
VRVSFPKNYAIVLLRPGEQADMGVRTHYTTCFYNDRDAALTKEAASWSSFYQYSIFVLVFEADR